MAVMRAWGFQYKTNLIWDKEMIGTGYWFRNQHEILLVGTRGDIAAPAMGTQWSSLLRERRTEHSAKPERVLRMIEEYYPTLPRMELNRRGPVRSGWDAWGLETKTSEAAIFGTDLFRTNI